LLLKNNAYDINSTKYGNTNLQTFSGYHGTSTSGVIGAIRNNKLGIDGIADDVRIMMVRAILGEDEYDKDVALAIRYAVDNGAQVINMSFGKPISPDKSWVDDAIRYAQSKDVVLVHAAGNEGKDIDIDYSYPNPYYLGAERMPHFINVGASGDLATGGLVAGFSNYGKKMVDVFAPGVDIECSIANNGTQVASGTSMASPVVAGIAALIRSYFPNLTAAQVVDIIKSSAIPITETVELPGNKDKKIPFQQLCETGGIVNAFEAIQLAVKISGQK
jgi:subtilisin family serine protease